MLCSRLEKRAATSVVDLWPSPFLRYQQMPIWVTELFFLLCLLFCFCWSSYKFPSNSMRVSFPLSRFPSTGRPAAAATESDRVVHRKKKVTGFLLGFDGILLRRGRRGAKGNRAAAGFFFLLRPSPPLPTVHQILSLPGVLLLVLVLFWVLWVLWVLVLVVVLVLVTLDDPKASGMSR